MEDAHRRTNSRIQRSFLSFLIKIMMEQFRLKSLGIVINALGHNPFKRRFTENDPTT